MHSDSLRAQPKQKRGQRRVDAILNAASERFAEVGYENATIIEIAARADTSVGSLYQFFANKEAILKALVERYVERASVVFAGMEVEAFPQMTLEQSIKAILVPLKAFIRDNRDFQVIFSSPTGSTYVDETIRSMDEAFLARTGASLLQARPNMRPEDLRKYSLVCMVIMKGLLGLAHHSSELTLDEVFEELEAVYLRYLTPLMGE
ncbi:MAG: TetR/AcrR family transcriptional regulator [Chloroflexi bacterium]|uniref:TetR/AcrR family transcriptional regulator n=1 Tax=Candidatus Flexifilum breve TaxID=3140694 RepID=UPI003134934A|nr:TetR/AcrR family transcriptional regulator [Chloroflexota bacterium]